METETKQKIEWTQKAIRELSKIDKQYHTAIRNKVNQLATFPQVNLDIKHLEGSTYRLRHGDYRIFFQYIEEVPKIIKIQKISRRTSQAYKN